MRLRRLKLMTKTAERTVVRSISQGRASFTMEPSHYEEVPNNVLKAIVEKHAAAIASGEKTTR